MKLKIVFFMLTICFALFAQEIPVEHTAGNSEGSVIITITHPNQLNGHDYEVFFNEQQYYLDFDGIWKEVERNNSMYRVSNGTKDVSPSTISGVAVTSTDSGTIDLLFTLDLIAPENAWVDGIKLDFPDDLQINSFDSIYGAYGSYTSGQNIVNPEGTLDVATNSITWGDSAHSTFGAIEGTVYMRVNVNPFTPPISVDYEVYDDGYDGTIVDAVGTATIDEINYAYKTEKHWNLLDFTTLEIVLEDQTIINGIDLYTNEQVGNPIVDGFEICVNGTYEEPVDFTGVGENNWENVEGEYNIASYGFYNWAETARAVDAFGRGTTDVDILSKDYEIRFTGVYADSQLVDTVWIHPIQEGTGSIATLFGARLYDIADHPMNPNPGLSEPFLVRLPFEVWNVTDNRQINIMIYDRIQIPGTEHWYAFNPSDRMYTFLLNTDYVEYVQDPYGSEMDYLTWNHVWWQTDWVYGDIIEFNYSNPITSDDIFNFSTLVNSVSDQTNSIHQFNLAQNYPNPFNPQTTINYSLPKRTEVVLKVYNQLGQEVTTLINSIQTSGAKSVTWDGRNKHGQIVSSGIYVYRLEAGDNVQSRKMLFLK